MRQVSQTHRNKDTADQRHLLKNIYQNSRFCSLQEIKSDIWQHANSSPDILHTCYVVHYIVVYAVKISCMIVDVVVFTSGSSKSIINKSAILKPFSCQGVKSRCSYCKMTQAYFELQFVCFFRYVTKYYHWINSKKNTQTENETFICAIHVNNLVLQCAHLKIKLKIKIKLLRSTSFTTLSSSGEAAEDKGQKFELFFIERFF